MKFKKTRFVFSVFFGMLTLFLIGLWVRSYNWADGIDGNAGKNLLLISTHMGNVMFEKISPSPISNEPRHGVWKFSTRHLNAPETSLQASLHKDSSGAFGIYWKTLPRRQSKHWLVMINIWSLIGILSPLPLVPWLVQPVGFSLRTLLVFITLVSLFLGLILYVARA